MGQLEVSHLASKEEHFNYLQIMFPFFLIMKSKIFCLLLRDKIRAGEPVAWKIQQPFEGFAP